MVMAASKITMVSDSDQRVASINHRVYPPATNNLSKLKVLSFLSHKFKEESKKSVALLNEKILQLTNEVDYLNQNLAVVNQYIAKPVTREKNLDVLPFTQVSSTCSSGIGNLSLVEIQDQQEQQDIKIKKQRIRQTASKQPNPDPLECNQTKQRRTSITPAKSAKIGKMQELSLITADDAYQRVASINHRVYPPATNNLSKLKVLSFLNHKFREESKKSVALLNEKILQLTNEVDYLKHKLAIPNQYIAKPVAREKNLDVLPFTQVSSTCSSGIGNLILAEIQDQQEQQDIKLKKQRIRQAASKQPNPDPLECNQTKQRRTSITQAKSAKIGKMQELSLITADDAYQRVASINHRVYPPATNNLSKLKVLSYYTCLGNYDPTKDEPVSKNTKSNLEIPKWKVIKYSGRRSVEDTEIMSDRIFEKRHHKHEQKKQIRKKRDLRQLKELIRVENLKPGRNKHQIQDQQEQRDIKLKKQRTRHAATKQPNPDPLESNQTKQRRTIITRAKSAKIGKMQELSLITTDDAYYTCLGNYDPTKDEPVSKNTKSNLETPSWRVIKYSGRRSVKGTEIMSDRIFEKRHHKHEQKEQICKRRDLRRLRELIRVENLKQGRYKHHSQKSNNKKELTTLLPSPSNIKAIEITDKLPVSAFECNLYNLYC